MYYILYKRSIWIILGFYENEHHLTHPGYENSFGMKTLGEGVKNYAKNPSGFWLGRRLFFQKVFGKNIFF